MKVATIGFFDGVHRGHRFLIDFVKTLAVSRGARSSVITFREHPAAVLGVEPGLRLLTLPDEKLARLDGLGVDEVTVFGFDRQLARMSARDFMQSVLRDQLGVTTLVMGHDHGFGARDCGHDYEEYGRELGIEVVKAPVYGKVCSSVIRSLLAEGRVEEANESLGYKYGLSGVVVGGKRLGRTIGFPTANLDIDGRKLIPKTGAYEVRVLTDGVWMRGMMNVGVRSIEVHIIDFDGDLYGKVLWVELLRMMREEMTFGSVDELRMQLEEDLRGLLSEVGSGTMAAGAE